MNWRPCSLLGASLILLIAATTGLEAKRACIANDTFACNDGRCIPKAWRCDGDIDCALEEDEKDCDDTCADDEFQCKNLDANIRSPQYKVNRHSCISKKWVCDGEFDCEDKSDEANCDDVHCNQNQFTCNEYDGQFKLCIPNTWVCDGQRDCASGADEMSCTKKQCEDTDYTCESGMCVFKNWKCDGELDCDDGSDEKECADTPQKMCESKNMFKCKHSEGCIPMDWLCDGEADCMDHSDERMNCSAREHQCRHPEREFACHSGHCVNKMWVCDGEEDCPDGSDETLPECQQKECVAGMKQCKNGHCVPDSAWCNGNEDCVDGSDEAHCNATVVEDESCNKDRQFTCPSTPLECVNYEELCKKSTQNNCAAVADSTCAKNIVMCKEGSDYCDCHNSYVKGFKVCYCRAGFRTENNLCIDINECEIPGVCDQICHNDIGGVGYSCSCHKGYKLSKGLDGTIANKCRALGGDPLVLLSNRATIRQFDPITHVHVPLIESPGSAVAMDFHLTNESIFWSDISKRKILKCAIGKVNNTRLAVQSKCEHEEQVLIDVDVHTPDGLAVDWIHNLLFWTDGGLDQVNVMDLSTMKRRTLFSSDLEEPRAIAVDPEMGLIFWTDWGKEARIERAGMDGQHRVVIVKGNNVVWPNGLALDYVDKRVYWADAKVKSIFSSDYWGQDIKTVLHSHQYLRHPFSLAVFEDRVYYTDWEHDGVITVNKFTGGEVKKVMQKVSTPMTVRIYHIQAQPPLDNKCDNSGCKEMCLPRAVYRGTSKRDESKWNDRPFACVCQGTTPSDIIDCAAAVIAESTNPGFSLTTMLLVLAVIALAMAGVVFYRRRRSSSSFTALNFDNPIYRRTTGTEADMEDPFRDPFRDDIPPTRLVLASDDQSENDIHNVNMEPMTHRPLNT